MMMKTAKIIIKQTGKIRSETNSFVISFVDLWLFFAVWFLILIVRLLGNLLEQSTFFVVENVEHEVIIM